jgi:hypothetical protein
LEDIRNLLPVLLFHDRFWLGLSLFLYLKNNAYTAEPLPAGDGDRKQCSGRGGDNFGYQTFHFAGVKIDLERCEK